MRRFDQSKKRLNLMAIRRSAIARLQRKHGRKGLNLYSGSFFALWFLALVVSVGFQASDEPYKAQIDEWHQKRINSLKSENGWLNLAGLFWLKEGQNTVGQGTGFDVSFPAGDAKTNLGIVSLQNGEVRFTPAQGAAVSANGTLLTESTVIFAPSDKPLTLAHNSLRWFIIKRGNQYGIRLRDLNSPLLKEFHGIDRFPVDESWRIKARLETPTAPKTIAITDVIGLTSQQPLVGTLVFDRDGKTYRLDAVGEGEKLFVIFGDATNAHDTYGAGRFLYADKPGSDGVTTLDFNQATNPPCAFTAYATCPLPPKQNKLALAITAGEKRFGDH
jgi:hypothetical protein